MIQWYNHCFRSLAMQNGGASETGTTKKEIRFDCPHCSAPLVIDAGASVKTLDCKRCRKSVRVPRTVLPSPGRAAAASITPPLAKTAPPIAPLVTTPPAVQSVRPSAVKTPIATPPTSQKPTAPPPTATPSAAKPPAPGAANISLTVEELERQLKENQSQRTEVVGQINQLNIQLHRWQLRLNMLNDRQKELESQLGKSKSD